LAPEEQDAQEPEPGRADPLAQAPHQALQLSRAAQKSVVVSQVSDLPYTTDVLRLAAEANGAGRLSPPCLSHTERNPVCGDRTTVDLRLAGDRIAAMAHDTKACVLTQASASILGAALTGHSPLELVQLRHDVEAMLKGGPAPDGAFSRYAHLAEVARHPARHRCVLLPLDAALKAASEPSEPGRQGS
jgi:nitrogen fixation protein NifU and related proteins